MSASNQNQVKKVVLAYSGGLDTSVILHWIKATYGAEVVAFTADIGQGDEVAEAKAKALRTGAVAAYAVDLQREFVEDFVFPVLRSGATYEGYYLLGTSFARPLIANSLHPSPSRLVPVALLRLTELQFMQHQGAPPLPLPFEGAGKEFHQPPSPRRAAAERRVI